MFAGVPEIYENEIKNKSLQVKQDFNEFIKVDQKSVDNIAIPMITERDYAPLSAACVRSLSDKLYEKRKAAALEIEK